ncbi:MAG: DNA repair protein RecN [Flavobacteriales bacterium]|nr:DNA repair protein RecN [Flavobacteriales bacterium]
MLKRISIQNYLLIDELELELGKGLTTITGETGSGKSILIGALALAMGERADPGVSRDATKRCVIEIEVDTRQVTLGDWCAENNVPPDAPMILRRQLDPGGRSRAFVNDTPVRLEQLRELGERLIHVHSQHHTLLLNDPAFQLGLIDHFAGQTKELRSYADHFADWRSKKAELESLREEEARAQSESDYLRFQLEELDSAKLIPDELPALELSLARADHAEEIRSALFSVQNGIAGDEGVLAPLHALRQLLGRTAKLDADLGVIGERINSVLIELQDIANEAERSIGHLNTDPKQAERMRDRLDLLLRLQQKHRVLDVAGLIALRDDLRVRIQRIGSLNMTIAEAQEEERSKFKQVHEQSHSISSKRNASLAPLAEQVAQLLKNLGMPHAVFHFEHSETEPTATGIDKVGARFSANKDRASAPLEKVASGGELSRVMLALIHLGAKSKSLPTVIFDEIDTGVSGETAYRVGTLMAQMAKDRQVIAITHLPQIASKADTHLLVSKDHEAQHVTTSIRPLVHEERVQALAQMISGKKTTKAAVDNARELLKGK